MAIFDIFTGGGLAKANGGSGGLSSGATTMTKEGVLLHTGGVTPEQVSFQSVSGAAILPENPRYLDHAAADALEANAVEKKELLGATKRGYKALEKTIDYDTQVHQIHRDAQITSADNELKRQQSNVKLASHLHGQRGEYAGLGGELYRQDKRASSLIAAKLAAYGGKKN